MAEEGGNRGNAGGWSRVVGEGWLAHIIRFIVAAIVLMVVSYITPGFTRLSFWYALLAAVLIAVIGYGLEAIFGRNISPYARGGVGFLVSAVIFYLIQFVIPGMRVTVIGALIAAAIVGIIDMFVPTGLR
ncbi:MAG: phage holin family protein [Firmicutes bacterium]|nr:phage holin family protein [Bacillota bacterium]